jgi:hypothetical protein
MPKKKEDNNTYASIYGADKSTGPAVAFTDDQFQQFMNRQSPYGSAFGSGSSSGAGSMLGIQAGKKALGEIASTYRKFGKNIGDYESYLSSAVQRGTMAPELAGQSYLSAAMFSNAKNPFEGAERLGTMEEGFVDPKKYEKYQPFMQLNAQQLLGRNLSNDEITNYTEAFRGMGVYKPADVSALFGNMLLTTPEARSREVVVSKGLFDKKPNFNLMA